MLGLGQSIQWSPDGSYFLTLCGDFNRLRVWTFQESDQTWMYSIVKDIIVNDIPRTIVGDELEDTLFTPNSQIVASKRHESTFVFLGSPLIPSQNQALGVERLHKIKMSGVEEYRTDPTDSNRIFVMNSRDGPGVIVDTLELPSNSMRTLTLT